MTKILIVDDDALVLKQLSELITSFGYEASYVPRAEFVLERLGSESFDLILMDINMPGINGIEMLSELKKNSKYSEIPVIMVTGVGDVETLAECFKCGATDYIEKPINGLVIKARVDAAIKMQNYIKEIIETKNEIIEKNKRIFKQEVQIEKQLAMQYKLKQLAAQMNPHFIFNALHSILYYVSGEHLDTARDYIVDFSNLMRKTLNNSVNNYITVKDECEYLEQYLQIESVRFDGKLTYEIIVGDKKIYKYLIPPMLIQPYVENAIVHGIQHKDGAGKLMIDFQLENGGIVCRVKDDGIGIVKSTEIKKGNKSIKHKSMAIGITNTRLELLNAIEEEIFSVNILNLEDKNGIPNGTEVVIHIPQIKKK